MPPARPGEFAPLRIGPLALDAPVVLAPMAGITNPPFRTLCRGFGAGLYVSEMITARALVERNAKTLRLAGFDPSEKPRSLQLYAVDEHYTREAVRWLVGEGLVDHIDMNFGCPVRKVTRRGGGAAIPLKPNLLRAIVRAAVGAAGAVPVTIKFRIGVDDALETFRDAGRIAEDEGCAAVAMHARTAAQLYAGEARWEAIAALVEQVAEHPGARQRRHLGGVGRAAHDARDGLRGRRRRPRLPRPPVAVPRPRRRVRGPRAGRSAARSARWRAHARTRRAARGLDRRAARRCATSASTPPGTRRASRTARGCATR